MVLFWFHLSVETVYTVTDFTLFTFVQHLSQGKLKIYKMMFRFNGLNNPKIHHYQQHNLQGLFIESIWLLRCQV